MQGKDKFHFHSPDLNRALNRRVPSEFTDRAKMVATAAIILGGLGLTFDGIRRGDLDGLTESIIGVLVANFAAVGPAIFQYLRDSKRKKEAPHRPDPNP